MRDKASCEQHDKHRHSCGECAVAELAVLETEHFPEALLGPWRERVAYVLGDQWEAKMLPRYDDEPVRWRLTRTDHVGSVTVATELGGYSPDDLVAIARNFHPPR
jgi:hypothetical protein